MKIVNILSVIVLLLTTNVGAQKLEPFCLQGMTVTALAYYGGALYAGTDGEGLFVHNPFDSISSKFWNELGLKGVRIRSVYPHEIGPIGWVGICLTACD